MTMIIRFVTAALASLKDSIVKAVPAMGNNGAMPRWRNLGRSITPYHFMQPVLIPIRVQQDKKA